MNDALGDRMKFFEGMESDRRFLPLLPVCCRLDGRSFSKFTKGLGRPFDFNFHTLMVETTKYLVEETCANMGYTQSDEISLVWYSDDYASQIFFDGRIQKMNSVLASMASVKFNQAMRQMYDDMLSVSFAFNSEAKSETVRIWARRIGCMPLFDSRVWQVPTLDEAVNVFLFREQDATKNSISMAASTYYSTKDLFEKNGSEKQELLFRKGINWNDYPSFFKRGTYIQRRKIVKKFTSDELDKLPPKHKARQNPDLEIERSEVRIIDLPPLNKIINRVEVIFNGAAPVTSQK